MRMEKDTKKKKKEVSTASDEIMNTFGRGVKHETDVDFEGEGEEFLNFRILNHLRKREGFTGTADKFLSELRAIDGLPKRVDFMGREREMSEEEMERKFFGTSSTNSNNQEKKKTKILLNDLLVNSRIEEDDRGRRRRRRRRRRA